MTAQELPEPVEAQQVVAVARSPKHTLPRWRPPAPEPQTPVEDQPVVRAGGTARARDRA
ncbi:hypothetical protein SBADM41S_02217 [Streptomyces badius]